MNSPIFLGIALGLALSFLFSGMEAGVFALSRVRIRRLMRTGNSNARRLNRYLENPEDFLWTILAGNTLANFAGTRLFLPAALSSAPWCFTPHANCSRKCCFGFIPIASAFCSRNHSTSFTS
jgi:CBS domain containing-hemolysin-like protein